MYQLRKRKSARGITVTEVMVAMCVFLIVIIGAGYALMSSGRMGYNTGDAKVDLQENLRQAMDAVVSELSESRFTRLTIEEEGNAVTFQAPIDEGADGSSEKTSPPGGPLDFYLEDTLEKRTDDNRYYNRWGAYLRREDPSEENPPAPRKGRCIRFLLVGEELRRRVLVDSDTGVEVKEDFLLADNIRDPNSDSEDIPPVFVFDFCNNVITIKLYARKLTIDRHPINYSLKTSVYLKNNINNKVRDNE